MPFLVLVFILVVVFFFGIVVGATFKGPLGNGEKKEAVSPITSKPKPRTYTITFTEDQLNVSQPLGENRFFLDISNGKPFIDPNFKIVKPPIIPMINELRDIKPLPLDPINLKPPIDIESDLIKFRNEGKKEALKHRVAARQLYGLTEDEVKIVEGK